MLFLQRKGFLTFPVTGVPNQPICSLPVSQNTFSHLHETGNQPFFSLVRLTWQTDIPITEETIFLIHNDAWMIKEQNEGESPKYIHTHTPPDTHMYIYNTYLF